MKEEEWDRTVTYDLGVVGALPQAIRSLRFLIGSFLFSSRDVIDTIVTFPVGPSVNWLFN
jgi:hypothetical protein